MTHLETRLTELEQAISELQFARDIAKSSNAIMRFNDLNRDLAIKIAQHDEVMQKIYFHG